MLIPVAVADHGLAALGEIVWGQPAGLVLTGSAVALLFAYVVRFLAVGLQTVDAGLGRIAPSLDDAARSLGAGAARVVSRVHLPLLRGSLLTASILVFVETMKEMPATLLLRPFGLDTLAVIVWERTAESLWVEAAVPALAIVVTGLLPVFLALRLSAREPRPRIRTGCSGPPEGERAPLRLTTERLFGQAGGRHRASGRGIPAAYRASRQADPHQVGQLAPRP